MPRPAAEQEAVLSGRLSAQDIYQNARYDAGYRMGWRDAHLKSRPSRRRVRKKYEEYAIGYGHGWEGGLEDPSCPEWDEAHRAGPLRELPEGCAWRPDVVLQVVR